MIASNARSGGNGLLVLAMLAFLALALGMVLASAAPSVLYMSHATDRHGFGAQDVRDCLNKNGTLQVWNRADGRHAFICQLGERMYGIQIAQKDGKGIWHEITSFIKEKLRTLADVEEYLTKAGYTRIQ